MNDTSKLKKEICSKEEYCQQIMSLLDSKNKLENTDESGKFEKKSDSVDFTNSNDSKQNSFENKVEKFNPYAQKKYIPFKQYLKNKKENAKQLEIEPEKELKLKEVQMKEKKLEKKEPQQIEEKLENKERQQIENKLGNKEVQMKENKLEKKEPQQIEDELEKRFKQLEEKVKELEMKEQKQKERENELDEKDKKIKEKEKELEIKEHQQNEKEKELELKEKLQNEKIVGNNEEDEKFIQYLENENQVSPYEAQIDQMIQCQWQIMMQSEYIRQVNFENQIRKQTLFLQNLHDAKKKKSKKKSGK